MLSYSSAVVLVLLGVLSGSHQVYDPKDVSVKPPLSLDPNWYPKYSTKSSQLQTGIKTSQQSSSDLQMHHNYSRINYQKSEASTFTQSSQSSASSFSYRGIPTNPPPSVGNSEKLTVRSPHNLPLPPEPRSTPNHNNAQYLPRDVAFHHKTTSIHGVQHQDAVSDDDSHTVVKKDYPKTTHPLHEGLLTCPEHLTGQFPYALNCRQFLNCWKGRGYLQNCAAGTLFNGMTLECDYPSKVNCIAYKFQADIFDQDNGVESNWIGKNAPRGRQSKSQRLQQIASFVSRNAFPETKETRARCPPGVSGLLPHPTDRNKFLNCDHGRTFTQACGVGTVFSQKINACDFPEEDTSEGTTYDPIIEDIPDVYIRTGVRSNFQDAAPHSERNAKTIKNTKQVEEISSGQQGFTILTAGASQRTVTFPGDKKVEKPVRCPKNIVGLIPHPTDCNKFLNCNQGRMFIQACGVGTVFNPDIKACDYPQNVDCNLEEDDKAPIVEDPQIDIRAGFKKSNIHISQESASSTTNVRTDRMQTTQGVSSSKSGHRLNSVSDTLSKSDRLQMESRDLAACPFGASGLFAHPKDCSKFLNCDHGRTFIQSCGPGTLYNPSISGCDYPDNVNCGAARRTQEELIDLIDVRSPPSSSGGRENTHTTTTWQSNRGTYQEDTFGKTPPVDTIKFSRGNTNINNNQQANRRHHEERNYGPTTPIDPVSASRTNHIFLPKCPANFAGLIPHPTDCAKFLNCGSGRTFIQDCGPGTVFNPNIMVCDYPYNVENCAGGSTEDDVVVEQPSSIVPNVWPQTDQVTQESQNIGVSNYDRNKVRQDRKETFVTSPQPQVSGSGAKLNKTGKVPQKLDMNVKPKKNFALDKIWQDFLRTHNFKFEEQQSSSKLRDTETIWREFLASHVYELVAEPLKLDRDRLKPVGNSILIYEYVKNDQNIFIDTSGLEQTIQITPRPLATGIYKGSNFSIHTQPSTESPPKRRPYPVYIPPEQSVTDFGMYIPDKSDTNIDQSTIEQTTDISGEQEHGSMWEIDPLKHHHTQREEFDEQQHHFYDSPVEKAILILDQPCANDRFECAPNVCVPLWWVCDGVKQCPNGKDEEHCVKYLNDFTKRKEYRLLYHDIEKWLKTDLNTCAKYCLEATSYNCKSFSYSNNEHSCLLSDSNSGISGDLKSSNDYDYYERKQFTMNCSSMFTCDNLKCIDSSKVCNSEDDCNDNSDEKYCKSEKLGYAIRLAGSNNPNEGRLEVKAFGRWGMVCDDKFGMRDATVACRELGFPLGAVQVQPNSYYYPETNEVANGNDTLILMDDVGCLGNETSLKDCEFNGWGVHDCLSQEVVGIVCKTPTAICPDGYWRCATTNDECVPLAFLCDLVTDCEDKSDENPVYCEAKLGVRLANGTSPLNGRVEINYHGVWGTICDDDFSNNAATVLCRQLGFHGPALAKKEGAFGAGSGPIWLDQVNCLGNETSVEDCLHNDWGQHNCEHGEDAAVICSDHRQPTTTMSPDAVHYPPINPKPVISTTVYPTSCGLRDDGSFSEDSGVAFKVVAGSIAEKGHYPWQASIRIKGQSKTSHWCGAVIITHLHVLTAAHCLIGFSKGSYLIRAGDYESEVDEGTEVDAFVEEFYIHEDFRKGHHMNNDIALIKLKSGGLPLENAIRPICLPTKSTDYPSGKNCTISGWGSTQSGKSAASLQLRAGWIPIQSQDVCRMPHVYGDSIKDGMFCAGNLDEGVDACDGDSGGPLACLDSVGLYTLYGLTSWGQHCGYANKPGVYVKVGYYADWIHAKIKESQSG